MYHAILCLVSIIFGALVASIADHIRFKHKYLGKLVLETNTDSGDTYIFAKVESQEALDNLKDGDEIIFDVEHSQK